MRSLILFFVILPSCLMAQEKIGNKIYKYGSLNSSINGTTLISFEGAQPKTMSKTLQFFSKVGVDSKSWNSLFLPGSEVSESDFDEKLNESNIETLIFIDITDAATAQSNRITTSAYGTATRKSSSTATRNSSSSSTQNSSNSTTRSSSNSTTRGSANSTTRQSYSSGSVTNSRTVDFTTEMSLRLTIFSKKDGFSKAIGVVEGRATNDSPDATADQLARRIVKRMVKALDEQNAF